ncbi:MAG: diadenylate cyclase CdaA [Verrucomicrobiota bacterium]
MGVGGGGKVRVLSWNFVTDHWRDGVEILVLWVVIYQLYRAFKATRGARILVGLAIVLVGSALISGFLQLEVISWILRQAVFVLAFALLIIFQPEIRSALAKIGSSRFFSFEGGMRQEFLEHLGDAVVQLSKKRHGALFALERTLSLKEVIETGVKVEADLSTELVMSLFFPKSPLHDGGVVMVDERIAAAGCVFPVSQKEMQDRSLGLRHRAAVGITEETDVVAVVVSEETGSISIAAEGQLEKFKNEEGFRKRLAEIFLNLEHEKDEESAAEGAAGQERVAGSGDRGLVSD